LEIVSDIFEGYYAMIGFRYVIEPPPFIKKSMEEFHKKHGDETGLIAMMWEAHQNKIDPSLTARPDLIVIDGGKGQLSTAVSVLKQFNMDIPVIGLAKREEEVFKPGESFATNFPSDSPAKFLLMRLRDEAHRFSNRHREMRAKTAMKASALDEMPGIGEETKRKLLKEFGSLSGVREASDADLRAILTESQLEMLRAHDNLP
jgi:excinuclease UvrABC nuclease subunit